MANNRSVRRRTNKLTKKLKPDRFIMNKKEIRLFTDSDPDFVATVKMFISGSIQFLFMFDNFREEALQTFVNYFLPRNISQPDWWPTTNSKWWAQLGFPTHKGEPPFELDSSKLPKVWKVAVLVGIIQNHSPKVICYALRLDEKMKVVLSDREKFIMSAALTILDQTFSLNSNLDFDSTRTTCKEYVVLGLASPQKLLLSNETGTRSADQSRKRKRGTSAKKVKALAIAAGTSSNPISSQAPAAKVNRPGDVTDLRNISDSGKSPSESLINTAEETPAVDVNRPDDVADLGNVYDSAKSLTELLNTSEEAPAAESIRPDDVADLGSISDSGKSLTELLNTSQEAPTADANRLEDVADLGNISDSSKSLTELLDTSEEAPAADANLPDDVADLGNISDSGKSLTELLNIPEEIQTVEVPAEPTLIPGAENKKECHKSISESSKEMDKMKGTDMGGNSTGPTTGIPSLGVNAYQVGELPISHELPHPYDEFFNNVIGFGFEPK